MTAGVQSHPYQIFGHPAHGLATRLDAAADRLIRTTAIPDNDLPYTVMLWAKIVTDTNTFAAIWSLNSSSSVDDTLLCNSDGTTFSVGVSGTVAVGGVNGVVGRWYHLAMVRESTTALRLYVNGTLQATETTSVARATPTRFEIGALTSSNTIPFNGSVYNPKAWQLAALTAGEVNREMRAFAPVSQLGFLYGWWWGPPGVPTMDFGPKRNHFTAAGTLTQEAGPVLWTPPSIYLPAWVSAGGAGDATASAGVAASTATANAATATGGASVTAASATSTATANAATATGGATATAAVYLGTMSPQNVGATGGANVTAASATSTATANAATATGGASVTAAAATATATAYAATASSGGDASVTAASATSTATAYAATATGAASATAAVATQTTTAHAATATGVTVATAGVAALTTTANAATATGSATVTAAVASALSTAWAATAAAVVLLPEVSGALVTPALMSNGGARAIVMSTGGATPTQRRVG